MGIIFARPVILVLRLCFGANDPAKLLLHAIAVIRNSSRFLSVRKPDATSSLHSRQ